jgi:hypothetical protein
MPVEIPIYSKTLLIRNISDKSNKILNLIDKIIEYKDKNLNKLFSDTDIQATIKTLYVFINEIDTEIKIISLNVALENLNNVIVYIYNIIKQISSDIEYHKTKYFNYLRYLNFYHLIPEIQHNNNILDKRFSFLIKLLFVDNKNIYLANIKPYTKHKNNIIINGGSGGHNGGISLGESSLSTYDNKKKN